MRFENGLEHDLVEGLLLCHLAVSLGLGYHYRSAGSSVSLLLGSADGSSKLPWPFHATAAFPLDGPLAPAHLLILSVASGVWIVEQAGHIDSL